jgi:enamine deaminase RidA (YjgF/YER057c/UK114 family)
MKKVSFLAVSVVLVFCNLALAQNREMIIPVPQSAYSQAVKVKGGTLLFLSGVGPADEKGVLAAPRVLSFRASAELGNFDAQFKRTFDKIKNTLKTASGQA